MASAHVLGTATTYIKIETLCSKNPTENMVLSVKFVGNSLWTKVQFLVELIIFMTIV